MSYGFSQKNCCDFAALDVLDVLDVLRFLSNYCYFLDVLRFLSKLLLFP